MYVLIKIKQLKPYYKLYKNWVYVLYSIYRQNDKIKLKLRSGAIEDMELKDVFDYTFKNYYYITGGYMKINNLKIKLNEGNTDIYNGDIGATFIREDYKWLKPSNHVIIDIGANVGDTPIYFISKGATKVIALEPFPYSYRLAKENILNNGYNDKIVLLNAGYGKDSEVNVEDKLTGTGDELTPSKEGGIKIKVFSMKTLLDTYNLNSALLKMDCEGCEYNLLREDSNTLKKFKRIQIEYHYGYEKLKEKLEEAGFTVTYSKPARGFNKDATEQNMLIGYIYAKLGV